MNKKYLDYILEHKPLYGGIGILMVICYHLLCIDESVPVYWLFYPGFIGVDLFMFFGGYSLCFSLEKHGLSEFYKRRLKRIAPLFILLAIAKSSLFMLRGDQLNLFDWFCNLTTLSYYHIGGGFIDWYLSALVLFYLLFPVLWYLAKLLNLVGVIILSVVISILLSFVDIDWVYGAAIARLPMFFLGIVVYQRRGFMRLNNFLWFLIPLVVSCFLYGLHTYIGGYVITDIFAPFLLCMIAFVFKRIDSKYYRWLDYCGVHSLEIYVANVLVMMIVQNWISSSIWILISYIVLSLITSILFIFINNRITSVLNKA